MVTHYTKKWTYQPREALQPLAESINLNKINFIINGGETTRI